MYMLLTNEMLLPFDTAFPFAKCFICLETGHIARECPDNPKGLYPNGETNKFIVFINAFSTSSSLECFTPKLVIKEIMVKG